jgi:hypothetical protein
MKQSVTKIHYISAGTHGHAQRLLGSILLFTRHPLVLQRPTYVVTAAKNFPIPPIGMYEQNI